MSKFCRRRPQHRTKHTEGSPVNILDTYHFTVKKLKQQQSEELRKKKL